MTNDVKPLLVHSWKKDGNMSFLYDDSDQVVQNRKNFIHQNNFSPHNCVAVKTQNSDQIAVVTVKDSGKGMLAIDSAIPADGLLTNSIDLGLFLLTADCLPIAILSSNPPLAGLIHVSFRNSQSRIFENTFELITTQFSIPLNKLNFVIGPHIHQYQRKLLDLQILDDQILSFTQKKDQFMVFGLQKYVINKLINLGIHSGQIVVSTEDTLSNPRLFSHAQSLKNDEKEGRFATLLALKKR